MNSSLIVQQCPARLVRLTLMFCEMRGKWPYSYWFVESSFRDLFKTVCKHPCVVFIYSFFSKRFIKDLVVHPYSSTDTYTA